MLLLKAKMYGKSLLFIAFSVCLKPQKQDASVVKAKPRLLNRMQEANGTGRGNQVISVSTNTLLPVCWLHLHHVTSDGKK